MRPDSSVRNGINWLQMGSIRSYYFLSQDFILEIITTISLTFLFVE